MPHRVLVTDLDNTLYDWVTYFANAFLSYGGCRLPDSRASP